MLIKRLLIGLLSASSWSMISDMPVVARQFRVADAWQQVYAKLPALPKENQYISRDTNQPDQQNTFVGRLISYHVYVKGRPRGLRLDWKHTIADYLNANESIDDATYPTQKRLRTNPLERDRAILKAMTRQQRHQLVQVLVEVLNPRAPRSFVKPVAPVVRPPAKPLEPLRSTPPKTAPLPGGADRLK